MPASGSGLDSSARVSTLESRAFNRNEGVKRASMILEKVGVPHQRFGSICVPAMGTVEPKLWSYVGKRTYQDRELPRLEMGVKRALAPDTRYV